MPPRLRGFLFMVVDLCFSTKPENWQLNPLGDLSIPEIRVNPKAWKLAKSVVQALTTVSWGGSDTVYESLNTAVIQAPKPPGELIMN